MAQDTVNVTEGSGKAIDAFKTTGNKIRQAVVIGDPSTDASVAAIKASDPASNDEGLVVRDPNTTAIVSGLRDIRIQSIVDGSVSVENITRVRNVVDGTLTLLTRADRVMNLVDGTLSTVERVQNIVDGTLSTVNRIQNVVDGTLSIVYRIGNVVDGTLTTITGLDRVRVLVDGTLTTLTGITNTVKVQAGDGTFAVYTNPALTLGSISHIDDTVKIAAADGTFAIYQAPGTAPFRVHGLGSTANIFTVSGSVTGSYPSGKTLVAPSANYSFKVYSITLSTTAQIASVVTLQNGGGSPTEFWRIALQAPTQGIAGVDKAIEPPGYFFATGASTTLGIAVDSGSLVHYAISYIKESA